MAKSWWAGRWIAALERLVNEGRLSRGRSYARAGQVIALEAGTAGVQAQVQGSRPKPYEVKIGFATLSDDTWSQVVALIAQEARYAAQLLSGEMPATIEDLFTQAKASLFPAGRTDLRTSCSCPDQSNPCKHIAAVHYLLGDRFDEDPFLIFELRGRTKDQILSELRHLRAVASGGEDGQESSEDDSMSTAIDDQDDLDVEDNVEHFWRAPTLLPQLEISFERPAVDALPIKLLGRPPFWDKKPDFFTIMEEAYSAISDEAQSIISGVDDVLSPPPRGGGPSTSSG